MKKYPYSDYVRILAQKFKTRLDNIAADYNFDYGDEFEIAVCEILSSFLPEKFGVCRGHIVNYDGEKVGDDIIIYDKHSFPTIRLHNKSEFGRKENIPVEGVYAYFEVKHTLTKESFTKALSQVRTVKEFVSKRGKVHIETFDKYLPAIKYGVEHHEDTPEFRNPLYSGILARGSNLTESEIRDFLFNSELTKYDPEVIVLNSNTLLQTAYHHKEIKALKYTTFLQPKQNFTYSLIEKEDDLVYGIFLINLISAIDWIKLGPVDWINILNSYFMERE
jgi:hypothetical protein